MSNIFTKHSKFNNLTLHLDAEQASLYVARQIAEMILEKQSQGKSIILGLATGKTPIRVYQELVRLHQVERLSFHNVISFNLDEYYPICRESIQSYSYFMQQHLFSHVDINPANIHIPHADCSSDRIQNYCEEYEDKIKSFGGLDMQLLGIGRNGHIGFNEPGSSFESTTRLVDLHSLTRKDAEANFGTIEKVPYQAISVGINTIIKAKRIMLLAIGKDKSEIISQALQGEISTKVPASLLQSLSHVEFVLDCDASALI
ncbi:MAG: glucosamine-6-phosphate deaminase [Xanthomarina sp.]